jgi:hypothetical protein
MTPSHCSLDEIKDCVDDQSKCTQIRLSCYNQELSGLLKATTTNLLTNVMGDTALYHSDIYDGVLPVADISDPNSNFL